LGVEEKFYLVWPLLVFLCSRRQLLVSAILLIVGTPLLRVLMLAQHYDPAAIYTFTLCRTDELAMGALVAVLAHEMSYERLARYARWAVALASLYLLAAIAIRRQPFWWEHWSALGVGFSALALGSAGLIVFALAPGNTLVKRVLENRTLRALGKYSYGAYVIHAPLEPLCLRLIPPKRLAALAAGLGNTGSCLVGLLGFTALGIGATLLLAVVSFSVYEKPFIRLKRFFEYGGAERLPVLTDTAPESR
jgi:peptidoglycan/LPS O-acetylase OafA/YrhL